LEKDVEGEVESQDGTFADYSEEQINAEIDRIGQEQFDLNLTKEDVVKNAIDSAILYERLRAAESVTELFKNQSEFINLVNKEFGVDMLPD
jgi:hypothetical protein